MKIKIRLSRRKLLDCQESLWGNLSPIHSQILSLIPEAGVKDNFLSMAIMLGGIGQLLDLK